MSLRIVCSSLRWFKYHLAVVEREGLQGPQRRGRRLDVVKDHECLAPCRHGFEGDNVNDFPVLAEQKIQRFDQVCGQDGSTFLVDLVVQAVDVQRLVRGDRLHREIFSKSKEMQTQDVDIVPIVPPKLTQISAVHPGAVSCHAATANFVSRVLMQKWLFTGGEDGFVRKFDIVASLNGESNLTGVQRHGLPDSIQRVCGRV